MNKEFIIPKSSYNVFPLQEIGGKAKGLGILTKYYDKIPNSNCLSISAMRYYMQHNGVDPSVKYDGFSNDELTNVLDKIKKVLKHGLWPKDLLKTLKEFYNRTQANSNSNSSRIILRSSHFFEDDPNSFSSGQYHSELVDSYEKFLIGIRKIWDANYSENSILYKTSRELPVIDFGMAVIIQEFIEAGIGGFASSINPLNGDVSNIIIDWNADIIRTNERKLIETNSVEIEKLVKLDKKAKGLPFDCESLVELINKIELNEEKPILLEWIFDGNSIQILQLKYYLNVKSKFNNFIDDPTEISLRSPKFKPIEIQAKILGQSRGIYSLVITPKAYRDFKDNNSVISKVLLEELKSAYQTFSNQGTVSVRSLYWSLYHISSSFPQSGYIDSLKQFLDSIKTYWKFILSNKLDDFSSEPALLVSNWIDISASVLLESRNTGNTYKIDALYGLPEGLEKFAHDVYCFDKNNNLISNRSIPEKQFYVSGPNNQVVPVTPDLRRRRVLEDFILHKILDFARKIEALYPFSVIELLIGDKGDLILWQLEKTNNTSTSSYFCLKSDSRFDPEKDKLILKGELKVIQIDELLFQSELIEFKDKIMVLDFSTIDTRRDNWLMRTLVKLKEIDLPFVYLGSSLSHFSISAIEAGLVIYPVNHLDHGLISKNCVLVKGLF